MEKGYWDAIHVVEVRPTAAGQYHYKLTSTVMLYLATSASASASGGGGTSRSLAGSVTRQMDQTAAVSSSSTAASAGNDDDGRGELGELSHEHVVTVGRMIEEMEAKLRSSLDEVYFKKTRWGSG